MAEEIMTMDDWSRSMKKKGFPLSDLEKIITEGKVIIFKYKSTHFNIETIYYCVTIDQVKEVIDWLYKKDAAVSKNWYKQIAEGNIFYDGLVFSLSKKEFEQAELTKSYDDKIAYLVYFYNPFFTSIDKPKEYLGTYPFELNN